MFDFIFRSENLNEVASVDGVEDVESSFITVLMQRMGFSSFCNASKAEKVERDKKEYTKALVSS